MFSIVDYYNYVTTTGSGATGKLLLVLLQVRQTLLLILILPISQFNGNHWNLDDRASSECLPLFADNVKFLACMPPMLWSLSFNNFAFYVTLSSKST